MNVLAASVAVISLFSFSAMAAAASDATNGGCPAPGQWHDAQGEEWPPERLFAELAQADVVLLGERHDRMEHHRWQLHTLAGLHARQSNLVIGLEMLPREAQPALDAWVAGELDEQAFLEQSDWHQAWGFDSQLYLPILHFARMHRIPLRGINVDAALRDRLVGEGWEAVPPEERHHIPPPLDAPEAYRERLEQVLAEHPSSMHHGDHDLDRFVRSQLVWDRAMAAGLAEAAAGGALAVGIIGSGHLQFGHGVPHQLSDLDIDTSRTLLPWDITAECETWEPGIADAVFGIAAGDRHEPPRPRMLGVQIEPDPAGVRIQSVMPNSVAEAAGLVAGDILTEAAGESLQQPGDLVAVVRRQQPGHVLPLSVLRGDEAMEILARFPAPSTGDDPE